MRQSFLARISLIPILLLFSLFIIGVIPAETIWQGILGNDFLQPWKILVIFFTVAYVAVSTDRTGIFSFFAHKIIHRTKGNGQKLFLFFFLFAGALTTITSNDIVILTLTPIIFYLGKFAKINIFPLLFAEFFAAHTFSMLLYTGDPTNIIVATTFGFGFTEYLKVMLLPTIVAATSSYLLLRWYFRKDLQNFKEIKHRDEPLNYPDAIVSFSFLLLMLLTLILSDVLLLEIWLLTSIFAGIFLFKDLLLSFYTPNRFLQTIKGIPWMIPPFIVSIFILVQSIANSSLLSFLTTPLSYLNDPISTAFSIGSMGIIFSNLFNNQPATILLTQILITPALEMGSELKRLGAFSLVVASNLGATFTLLGALAGLMWQKILRNKGLTISYLQFTKTTLAIALPVSVLTLLSLLLVV